MSTYTELAVINKEDESSNQFDDSLLNQSIENAETQHLRVYKIRWFMLFLLVMCNMCAAFQCLQFSIIANIIVEYYNVSYNAVDWSSMVVLLLFIPLSFPVMHIYEKIGSRASLLMSMLGVSAAAWIKVGSVAPNRFWVVILGQITLSTFQVFLQLFPAQFASDWFKKDETGIACSIGVLGLQLGFALGCFIPVMLVKLSQDKNSIGYDMQVLNIAVAVLCTICLILTFSLFKSIPPTPPTNAQKRLKEMNNTTLKQSTPQLFRNRSYVLLFIAFSITGGVFYTTPTLLNQIILEKYPSAVEDTGKIGFVFMVLGMFGIVGSGYVLDKLQRYRITTIMSFVLNALGMVAFSLAFLYSVNAVYIAITFVGFIMNFTFAICLQVAAELTYPVPASTSSGYLLAVAQATGIIFIYIYSYLLYKFSVACANIVACIGLIISTILIISVKFKLKRQAAENIYIRN